MFSLDRIGKQFQNILTMTSLAFDKLHFKQDYTLVICKYFFHSFHFMSFAKFVLLNLWFSMPSDISSSTFDGSSLQPGLTIFSKFGANRGNRVNNRNLMTTAGSRRPRWTSRKIAVCPPGSSIPTCIGLSLSTGWFSNFGLMLKCILCKFWR